MKIIFISLSIILSIIYSSTSFAKWTNIYQDARIEIYVDLERIIKNDGYHFFWSMDEYLKPLGKKNNLFHSNVTFTKVECSSLKHKPLKAIFYKGKNKTGESITGPLSKEWDYPLPGSIRETVLKKVCKY